MLTALMLSLLPPISSTGSSRQECQVGAVLELRHERDDVSRAYAEDRRLKYRETLRIRPAKATCVVEIIAFHPNANAARLNGDRYVWFRSLDGLSTVTASPNFVVGANTYHPMIGLEMARPCDGQAVASTTFGSFSSCAALHRDAAGMLLRITSHAPQSGKESIEIRLPPLRRYVALSAGDWAHDVGGEIALIRAGGSSIDIFTLQGS